jgi:formylglycine-generating enzyme required for sulfatase activity
MINRNTGFIRHYGKSIEVKDEDRVTLPSLFGIAPELYLAFLYGALLLVVLFFILVFPGIVNPGSLAVFNSEPSGAAIRVDDVTLGYTPCKVFIPRGKRLVEFILPGFEPDRQELEIKGKLFASLFVPRKLTITGNLPCRDPAGTFAFAALDYIHWSAAGEPTETYQIPLSLSEGAYRIGPTAKDAAIRETMETILDASLRYAVTKAAARDLLRAQFLIDNAGLSPSPLTIIRSMQKAAALLGNNPAAAEYLAELLPDEEAERVAESVWYQKTSTDLNAVVNSASDSNTADTSTIENSAGTMGAYALSFRIPGALSLAGVDFSAIPAGFIKNGGQTETMPPMLIARSPVTLAAWEVFAAENPGWSAENRETLIVAGLVEESFLLPVDSPAYPEPAAPGISWYAAAAYCTWLNSKLPPSLAGWEVKLRSEAEWEYGIRQSGFPCGALWEWCDDPYAPLNFFPIPKKAADILIRESGHPLNDSTAQRRALERTVRGGSWINPPNTVSSGSRGSLPPESSSPFTGFRPVIVPKQGI